MPGSVELKFLETAKHLEFYGTELYPVLVSKEIINYNRIGSF